MPIPMRFAMAAAVAFAIFMLALAVRRGRIISGPRTYDIDENPLMYGLTFVGHIVLIILFAAFAAGYTPAEVRSLAGFGSIDALRSAGPSS